MQIPNYELIKKLKLLDKHYLFTVTRRVDVFFRKFVFKNDFIVEVLRIFTEKIWYIYFCHPCLQGSLSTANFHSFNSKTGVNYEVYRY